VQDFCLIIFFKIVCPYAWIMYVYLYHSFLEWQKIFAPLTVAYFQNVMGRIKWLRGPHAARGPEVAICYVELI
jgi:hypothetical protein